MTLNPRHRNLVGLAPSVTERARKPALIKPQVADPGLARWIQGVTEHLELAEGSRGRPLEQTLTRRDLEKRLADLGIVVQGVPGAVQPGPGVVVTGPNGTGNMSFEQFAESIRSTKLYRDLVAAIDDPTRFDDLPSRTRDALLPDIASLERRTGAMIRRLDEKFQSANESFAQTITEVTANVAGAAAGVRQVMFASASANRATAGIVTQVQARLDNFSGGAPGTATIESKMTAIADRSTGLEAQYTLKVATNGAIAGFGLAATTSAAGVSTSSMLFLANKFAFISSTDVLGTGGGQINPISPPANRILFGIDSDGAYVGGNLKVTGKAFIDGVASTTDGIAALAVNNSNLQTYGLIARSNASAGAAVLGSNTNGGNGISGVVTGGTAGRAVSGLAIGSGKYAGWFSGLLGSKALLISAGDIEVATAGYVNDPALFVSTATFTATKPGTTAPNSWLRWYQDGLLGWIPWWPDVPLVPPYVP